MRFPGCHSYRQQSPQTPLALLADALDGPAEPLETLGHACRELREVPFAQALVVRHGRRPT